MINDSYTIVTERKFESKIELKKLFNEKIPNMSMHDVNKYMKGPSKQFICKNKSIFVGGAIMKLRGGEYEIMLIASNKRKRGIGQALISFMCKHYAKLNIDKLFVNADILAKGFYVKQGFKDVDKAYNYTTLMSVQTTLPEGFICQERVKQRHLEKRVRRHPQMLEKQERGRINMEKEKMVIKNPVTKNGIRRRKKRSIRQENKRISEVEQSIEQEKKRINEVEQSIEQQKKQISEVEQSIEQEKKRINEMEQEKQEKKRIKNGILRQRKRLERSIKANNIS
jgi:hypothetical protein